MIMEFLEKLNNGEKITYDEMELKFSQIKNFVDDILYSINDFPVDIVMIKYTLLLKMKKNSLINMKYKILQLLF